MKQAFYIAIVLLIFVACSGNGMDTGSKEQPATVNGSVPQERLNPNPKPVAAYSENINSDLGKLNHWKFAVAIYETGKTLTYCLQVQYAELNITDSLQLPDLGWMPKPALQKGKDNYSCIIGFLDNKDTFRDYKSVIVINGNVRIHTLKYYSVQRSNAAHSN